MKKLQKNRLASVVIYVRVSSKEQQEEGYSIPSQLKLLREYAVEKGLHDVREFIDVETAKKAGRSAFIEMVRFLESTSASESVCRIIIVEKTDRLYRNFKDWVTIDELDAELHFVKEGCVMSKESRSMEKFVHGVKLLMAKNYIDNLSEEVKKGMLEKAEEGIFPSRAPLGYINVECDGKRFIQPDPDVAPVIKRLFELFVTGRYSIEGLVGRAYEEGLRYRKSGSKLHKSAVYYILRNPVYYGVFNWAGKRYRGTHKPIITREVYDRVQHVLRENGSHRRRQIKHSWPFQGLVSCGHCGCLLTPEIKKGKYVYYHCTGQRGKCPERYVREEELDRQFREALGAIRVDDEVLEWMVEALRESHRDEKSYHNEMVAQLQKKHQRLQDRIDAMYMDKLDGRITPEYFDSKSGEWQEEQARIRRGIERHVEANKFYLDEGTRILELTQKAAALYDRQDMHEKRRILDLIFSNSAWKDGRLVPKYRQPFDMLALTNALYLNKEPASPDKNGLNEKWYA